MLYGMSHLIARLLLTIFLVPLTVLIAIVSTIIAYEARSRSGYYDSDGVVAIVVGLITWAFFAVCWVFIWRRGINWTPGRIRWTWIWPFASTLVATLIGLAFSQWEREAGYFFAAVTAPLIWVVGTILIWRETDAERKGRQQAAHVDVLTCPTCGYNLTGLSEARCPECGSKFTLNDLYANQPTRATAAMDQEMTG